MTQKFARAMTIAGSDSGGGAGIQADLKTFTALGVFGTSAIAAITAQNTLGVQAVLSLPVELVVQQIDSVLGDIGTDAAKTGMLADPALIEAVAGRVRQHALRNLVVDPVIVAKGGFVLVPAPAQAALRQHLLPLALVATPNRYEAAALTGRRVESLAEMAEAARAIAALGPRYVVVKGGALTPEAIDVVYDGHAVEQVAGERIDTTSLHGTGCTYSAAIVAFIAHGLAPAAAIAAAKAFVTQAIKAAVPLGRGHGPTNHLFRIPPV